MEAAIVGPLTVSGSIRCLKKECVKETLDLVGRIHRRVWARGWIVKLLRHALAENGKGLAAAIAVALCLTRADVVVTVCVDA